MTVKSSTLRETVAEISKPVDCRMKPDIKEYPGKTDSRMLIGKRVRSPEAELLSAPGDGGTAELSDIFIDKSQMGAENKSERRGREGEDQSYAGINTDSQAL